MIKDTKESEAYAFKRFKKKLDLNIINDEHIDKPDFTFEFNSKKIGLELERYSNSQIQDLARIVENHEDIIINLRHKLKDLIIGYRCSIELEIEKIDDIETFTNLLKEYILVFKKIFDKKIHLNYLGIGHFYLDIDHSGYNFLDIDFLNHDLFKNLRSINFHSFKNCDLLKNKQEICYQPQAVFVSNLDNEIIQKIIIKKENKANKWEAEEQKNYDELWFLIYTEGWYTGNFEINLLNSTIKKNKFDRIFLMDFNKIKEIT